MYLWWSLCTLYLLACQVRVTADRSLKKKKKKIDVPLVEFMYHVFTRMPGESYRRRLRSLLWCLCDDFRALINSLVRWLRSLLWCLCDDFRVLINSLVCWFCTSECSGPRSVSDCEFSLNSKPTELFFCKQICALQEPFIVITIDANNNNAFLLRRIPPSMILVCGCQSSIYMTHYNSARPNLIMLYIDPNT